MEKKIIAIALVLVLMVTALVGCSKKYETTKLNGKEYLLVTDDEGNTVINDKNQVAAVVTDEDGEIITYENGEQQTYQVQLYGPVVVDGAARGTNYKINIPQGWTAIDGDKISKDKTEDNCYIQFAKVIEFDKDNNLDTYLEKIETQNKQLVSGFEKEGYTLTVDESDIVLTADNLHCRAYIYKVVDADGKLIHYAENYYFAVSKTAYKLSYVCEDGIGYDETFNFKSYANENFTFVK